jgi:hypothetical protein
MFVGSVPVGFSVSPNAVLSKGDLKLHIVLISLLSFFDFIVFILVSVSSKLSAYKNSVKFVTRRTFSPMRKDINCLSMT